MVPTTGLGGCQSSWKADSRRLKSTPVGGDGCATDQTVASGWAAGLAVVVIASACVCRESVGQLVWAAERGVVAAVHLVWVDAESLLGRSTATGSCPRSRSVSATR